MPPRFEPLVKPAPSARPTRRNAQSAAASVVVVNYQQRDHTTRLLEELDHCEAVRTGAAEVVLVDNDADPTSLKKWADHRPGVRWLGEGRNRGFARAVNDGVRSAGGTWVLLLNPDVSVPDEFLDRVVLAAAQRVEIDPNVGIIGFGLRHADGTPQPSTGPFPTFANVMTGLFRRREYRRCRPVLSRAAEVPWATGCCLMVRRACWEELDGCDEEFFLYYEDVDLCRRARAAGWTVWHDPNVAVTHYHPLHSRPVAAPLRLITRHALLTYAAKHWPNWQFHTLARMIGSEGAIRARLGGRNAAHFARLAEIARCLRRGQSVRARHLLAASAGALSDSPDGP